MIMTSQVQVPRYLCYIYGQNLIAIFPFDAALLKTALQLLICIMVFQYSMVSLTKQKIIQMPQDKTTIRNVI